MINQRLGRMGLALACLLLSACATSPPTNFYTLSAQTPEPTSTHISSDRVVIGVGPIEVAPYLERSQIVTRGEQTRLNLTEQNHWAEPMETNISRVLATNLSRILPATQAIVRPWPDAQVEHHVLVKIIRFDSDLSGMVQLTANWGIQLDSTQSMPVIREANIIQPSAGEDYAAITRNMSLALASLSEQIAEELGTILRADIHQ